MTGYVVVLEGINGQPERGSGQSAPPDVAPEAAARAAEILTALKP